MDGVGARLQPRVDVRHAETEVVVGVEARRAAVCEPRDDLRGALRVGRADGVAVADSVCTGVEAGAEQAFEVVEVGARAVLAEHLDPQAVVCGVLDELDRRVDHVVAGRADLRLDVFVRRGDDEVDPVDAAVERVVDVGFHAAGEARHGRVEPLIGHSADGLAFALGGARRTGFDQMHPGRVELAGDVDLLGRRQRDARHLLAVAERRV